MTDTDYTTPQAIDDVSLAFPANLGTLLPPMSVIPTDYPDRRSWQQFQSQWFAGTLPDDAHVHAVPGVSAETATRHLAAIQKSFEPKHEHKVAAVAWLASLWFSHVSVGDGTQLFPTPAA